MGELVDLEVCEISLVDRPATGRRFRVYKREPDSDGEAGIASLVRRLLTGKEAPACGSGEGDCATNGHMEDVRKALDALDETVKQALERIEKLEQVGPMRQSTVVESSLSGGSRLWKGVL
ncbi:MAG: hypothetical protein ACUVTZ_08540 [Armatimonadota bacterium]